MYELLTSKPPFSSGNVDRQIHEKVPPSMTQRRKELEIEAEPIDEAWEETVRVCLAKDPAKRPQSITEVARRLEVPSPKTDRSTHDAPVQPSKWGSAVGAATVILLIGIGVWYFGFRHNAAKVPNAVTSETLVSGPQASPKISAAPEVPAPPPAVATGGVIVDTSPSGAKVSLGGTDAKSPFTFKDVPPGKYPLAIFIDGYETIERQVEVKENQFNNLGTITLQPIQSGLELSSMPSGAKVLQNGSDLIGTTPIRRNDLHQGESTFLFVLAGYLPREIKGTLDPKQVFKQEVSLAQPAPIYSGRIRIRYDSSSPSVPLTIALASDLKSGTMTQSSRSGDLVVKFSGIWEGTNLRAVTDEVISKPSNVRWSPEGFTLRFSDDGKSASYECVADGKTYVADLSAQSASAARVGPVYKGTIGGSGTPLTINLAADRKSGTMTQTSKSGDTVVRFNGVWDGTTLRAVTDEVISKPKNIQWKPESFTLRFAEDGKRGSYECNSEGRIYTAELSPP
jgi:serine/threonine protein kinase